MRTVEQTIGYNFKNKNILQQALTHSSCTGDINRNYERLEFLGDRILGVAVAQMLYKKFPHEPEGSLSQRHVSLVCKEAVSAIVRKLGINQFVKIANEDIRDSDNVLCDVGEAVIGAISIDSDINTAIDFVQKNWLTMLESYARPPKDSKTMLQEIAHELKLGVPEYILLEKSGAEHLPIFKIAVRLADKKEAIGEGHNKKLAEQEAATKMLADLGYCNECRKDTGK